MKKLSIIFVLFTLTAILMTACAPNAEEPVVAETISQPNFLITEGRLMPANYLDQSFSVPGLVLEIMVQEGDTVEIGQTIAKLDVPYSAMVAFAQNQTEVQNAQLALEDLKKSANVILAQSRLDVFNAQTLVDDTQEDYDADDSEENRLRLDVALARLESAQENLAIYEEGNGIDKDRQAAAESRVTTAMTAMLSAQSVIDNHELKASVGGTVSNVNIKAGERINAGFPIITIADFANWEIETDNLTEINVVNVQVGQKVEVVLDALPDKTFTGIVSDIDMVYQEKRGDTTYTATIVLDQSDPQMRWGMTAAIQFLP